MTTRKCTTCGSLALLPLVMMMMIMFRGVVNAGSKHVLSVEPYVAEWCAAQFPEQLGQGAVTGHTMAELVRERNYKLVEPYLGSYCFELFGHAELKDQKQQETLRKMHMPKKTIQVEPYLMEWGQKAMLAPTAASGGGGGGGGGALAVPDVETSIAHWCVRGQFHRLFGNRRNRNKILEEAEKRSYPVSVEVALVPWCFDQFPEEMVALDKDFYVKRMQTDHVKIEDYLIKWEIANFHMRTDPRFQQLESNGGSNGSFSWIPMLLVIASVVVGVGYIHRKHPHVTQAAQDGVQQLIASLRSREGYNGGGGGGGGGGYMPMTTTTTMTTDSASGSYNPLTERMVVGLQQG